MKAAALRLWIVRSFSRYEGMLRLLLTELRTKAKASRRWLPEGVNASPPMHHGDPYAALASAVHASVETIRLQPAVISLDMRTELLLLKMLRDGNSHGILSRNNYVLTAGLVRM